MHCMVPYRKRVGFSGVSATDSGSSEEIDGRRNPASSLQKVFHEELVLQWIVSHPNLRVLILSNAWFFFELLVCVCVCVKSGAVKYTDVTFRIEKCPA